MKDFTIKFNRKPTSSASTLANANTLSLKAEPVKDMTKQKEIAFAKPRRHYQVMKITINTINKEKELCRINLYVPIAKMNLL